MVGFGLAFGAQRCCASTKGAIFGAGQSLTIAEVFWIGVGIAQGIGDEHRGLAG